MGVVPNFPTALLRPPNPIYAVREFDEAHVQELIESFEEKESMNGKGIRVVTMDKYLWNTLSVSGAEGITS